MPPERAPASTDPAATKDTDELERALAELREANDRLITAGVRMQELAEEAEAANRAKDEFLATLSHELRTPLNAILGWTHMLRRTTMTAAAADRALEIIERNARSQSQLIADLLQVSQIITGKLRLEVEPTDLASMIQAGIEAVRPTASAKRIRMESRSDPDVRPVLADPSRVQQIIWNLFSNAIKFTPPSGQIDIELRSAESAAEIVIRDSGIGIESGLLPHVFDRFRQGNSSRQHTGAGLGLGLAIVRQLMELHGGSVKAESSGPDRGATFTLTFPVAAPTPVRERHARPSGSPILQGLQVLMIEHESDSRGLLAALLTGKGALVTVVTSVREAVAQFEADRPDLLIADIDSPEQDGYELIRQVRMLEEPRARTTPAVALTACAHAQDHQTSLGAGFQVHMAKPVDPDEFVAAVAHVTRRIPRAS